MARIATLSGKFLVPGVSANGRRYTPENIGAAVRRMNERLSSGQPIPMHTSHEANARGDTRATAAHITAVKQLPDGSGHFEAEVLDTDAGKDIRTLTVPDSNGRRALRNVSIFGKWAATPEQDADGNMTAPDLDVRAVDFTHRPGVEGAQIDDARLAEMALAGAFGESADAEGVFAENAAEVLFLEDYRPSALAMFEAELSHVFEDGTCTICLGEGGDAPGDGSKPYGTVTYADPGYQSDKKKRYPINTKAHVRAALAYIGKAKNAGKYTAAQLKRVKARIHAAAKKFGIDIEKESELLTGLLESLGSEFADVLEAYASSTLDNGQGSISVSAYTDEPADLPKVGAAVARAALAGLLKLDPDNDGDVDIAPTTDPDHAAPPGDEDDNDMECTVCGASGPSDAMFCPQCGQPVPGAEDAPADPEEGAMPKHTSDQVKALLTAEQAATLDPSKTEYTTEEVQALLKPATSPVEALAAVIAAAVAPQTPALSAEESKLAEAKRIIAEAEAAASAQPATVAQIAEMLKAERAEIRKELIEDVRRSPLGPRRMGLVEQGAARLSESDVEIPDTKTLAAMPSGDFTDLLGQTMGQFLPQPA